MFSKNTDYMVDRVFGVWLIFNITFLAIKVYFVYTYAYKFAKV